jgi:hypothetical protein
MPAYRAYFLDPNDHITGTEVVESASLGSAIDVALTILKGLPRELSLELCGRVKTGAARCLPSFRCLVRDFANDGAAVPVMGRQHNRFARSSLTTTRAAGVKRLTTNASEFSRHGRVGSKSP